MNDTDVLEPTKLVIRRIFAAPRDRVWAAWTEPERMKQWSGPKGYTVPEFEYDPRVGGAYRMVMLSPTNERLVVRGEYREIDAPRKLVYTWTWEEDRPQDEHETLLSLEFDDLGDGRTQLTLTQEHLRDEASKFAHTGGWNECLDCLADYLVHAR